MPHSDPEQRRKYARERARKQRGEEREKRNAKRREELLTRDTDPIICAQAAGLFDGEGTAAITRSGREGYSRCIVSLSSTDRDMIEWLDSRWSGSLTEHDPPNPDHNVSWTWRLHGDAILPFLTDIRPYLITIRKQRVVDFVIECQQARWEGQRSEGYREKIEAFFREVRTLNHRGR